MPSFNWSSDFTTVTGVDFADSSTSGVLYMFFKALRERTCALSNSAPTNTPAPGEDLIASGWNAGFALTWPALQAAVDSMATYYCRPQTVVGSSLVLNLKYSDAANTVRDRAFPYPNGWGRKFRRVIYTVSQAGTDGQRARFESQPNPITCYSVLSTDPLYHTTIQTPSGEFQYSGKYFDHTAGSWQLSADQTSDADVVSEYGTTLVQPGDFCPTGQMMNDIRDAINQLTETACFQFTVLPPSGSWPTNLNAGTLYLGNPATLAGRYDTYNFNSAGAGTGTSIANADANWSVYAGPARGRLGRATSIVNPGGYFPDTYSLSATNAYPFLSPDGSSSGSNNPLGQTRTVSWFVYTSAVMSGGLWVSDNLPSVHNTSTFDAQGTGVLNQQWSSMGADSTTASTTVNGPDFPETSGTVAIVNNWPSAPPSNQNTVLGWADNALGAVLNWGVSGGFVYVSGYAGT